MNSFWQDIRKKIKWRYFVQFFFSLVTIGLGIKFIVFLNQTYSGEITWNRPAGIEGFLPVSALVGLKAWLSSGIFDYVHPAGLVIFLLIILVSLLIKRGFCAWICPVGTLAQWLGKLGKRIFKRNFKLPKGLDYGMRSIKYILLGIFVLFIGILFSGAGAQDFLMTPYNIVADAQMLGFFQHMSVVGLVVLSVLVILNVLIENFWCRYLCPYGALTGLVSWLSPVKVERSEKTCINCGACTKACPNRIEVERLRRVTSPECTGCLDCIEACPVKNTLAFKAKGMKKGIPVSLMAVCILMIWFGVIEIAKLTGHWDSRIPQDMYIYYLHILKS